MAHLDPCKKNCTRALEFFPPKFGFGMGCSLILGISLLSTAGHPTSGADKNGPPYPWQSNEKPTQDGRPTKDDPRPTAPALARLPADCEGDLGGEDYRNLALRLSQLTSSATVMKAIRNAGLDLSTVSWQDTGRSHGSSFGANISDVRLAAVTRDAFGETKPVAMPIARLPNFKDVTVDVEMDSIFVPVGNAWGLKETFAVSLKDLLIDLGSYLSWREPIGSLYEPGRDSQVLVSAQASILPVLKNSKAYFVPSIFNYQSSAARSAVLVILVSNRGTSVTIIDNSRDRLSANGLSANGQMLFHNDNGEKTTFVLEDLGDVKKTKTGRQRVKDLEASGQEIAGQSGVNQVMMIQVPLEVPPPPALPGFSLQSLSYYTDIERTLEGEEKGDLVTMGGARRTRGGGPSPGSRLNAGVVDTAKFTLGKFVELNGKTGLKRDARLPIRVDVMYYFGADGTDFTPEQIAAIPDALSPVYNAGFNLGSLVTGSTANRLTRNHRPWEYPWWKTIVLPVVPTVYRDRPADYFAQRFGDSWIVMFATEEMAAKTATLLREQGG